MPRPTQGLADGLGIGDVTLAGQSLRAAITQAVTDVTLMRTIAGASTLAISILDPARDLVRSPIFASRVNVAIDGLGFEFVKLAKAGDLVTVTCEDNTVAALRRRTGVLAAAAGTTTRVGFAQRLVAEVPGAGLIGWPGAEPLKESIGRGTSQAPNEDSWAALVRLATEVGWRCFVVANTIWYGPDSWLMSLPPLTTIREHTGGVDDIDFSADVGKPIATATFTCTADGWAYPPGSLVRIADLGVATGGWLVASINRSLYLEQANVALTSPQRSLAEPTAQTSTAAGDKASQYAGQIVAGGTGLSWPAHAVVTQEYGHNGHPGIDIGVTTGTPITAAGPGSVAAIGISPDGVNTAPPFSGYGNAVLIDHGKGVQTLYAHLSVIQATVGEVLTAGQQIGLSGSTGNSTGPHLHFEVRTNGRSIQPRSVITGNP